MKKIDANAILLDRGPDGLRASFDAAPIVEDGRAPIPVGLTLPPVQPFDLQRHREEEGRAWPAPDARYLRPPLPEPPMFPLDDVFSPRWATWARAAAEAKSAPVDYVAAAALVACGSLIGNARWATPWPGWTEPPILWSVIVGNPSSNKSPALDAVLLPLKTIERRMREKDRVLLEDWKARAEVAKLAEAAWKESVKASIKNDEEPPPRPASANAGAEPLLTRLVASDVTIERLAVLAAAHPRALLMARDELAGWLLGMSRYSGGGNDRPFWLEAYGGRGYAVERIGRDPTLVERLSIGVLGGIQPDRLRSLLMTSDDDGLLARFLPIWPHPVPVKRPALDWDESFIENAMGRLLSLEMPMDGDGHPRPCYIPFSDEARGLLDSFRMAVRGWERDVEGLMLSHIGKLPGIAVRLSLILSFMSWASGEGDEPREIAVQHFRRAAHFLQAYALPMARRAYADGSVPAAERTARRLLSIIRDEGWPEFNPRQVRRMQRTGLTTMAEVDPALNALIEADIIRPADAGSGGARRAPFPALLRQSGAPWWWR